MKNNIVIVSISVLISVAICYTSLPWILRSKMAVANTAGLLGYAERATLDSFTVDAQKGGADNLGIVKTLKSCVNQAEDDYGVTIFEKGAIASYVKLDLTPVLQKCLVDNGYPFMRNLNVGK